MADYEEIRKTLSKIKPKKLSHINKDRSNIKDILAEYNAIHKVSNDLVKIRGKELGEAIETQPSEYHFFSVCTGNLRVMMEHYERLIRSMRGELYREIKKSESRDLSDRSVNQLIDSNKELLDLEFEYFLVRDVYEDFNSTLNAYVQRGYALNNLTRIYLHENENLKSIVL